MKHISSNKVSSIAALGVAALMVSFAFSGVASAATVDLLSNSSTWYKTASGMNQSNSGVSNGTLTYYRASNQNGEMISYFSNPVDLAVGEQITLEFSYKLSAINNRGDGLRIGLFDSNGSTKVTTDGYSSANAQNYTGYFLGDNPESVSSTGTKLYSRDNTDSGYIIGGGSAGFPGTKDNESQSFRMTANQYYNGSLSIAYVSASTVKVTYSFNTGDETSFVSWIDSADGYTSFDTIALSLGKVSSDTEFPNMTISSMTYEVSAIPEPSSFGAVGGIVALMAFFALRKRARR